MKFVRKLSIVKIKRTNVHLIVTLDFRGVFEINLHFNVHFKHFTFFVTIRPIALDSIIGYLIVKIKILDFQLMTTPNFKGIFGINPLIFSSPSFFVSFLFIHQGQDCIGIY